MKEGRMKKITTLTMKNWQRWLYQRYTDSNNDDGDDDDDDDDENDDDY